LPATSSLANTSASLGKYKCPARRTSGRFLDYEWLVLHQRMACMLRMQLFLADGSIPIAIENSESLPAGIFLESHYFAISEDIKAM